MCGLGARARAAVSVLGALDFRIHAGMVASMAILQQHGAR